MGVGMSHIDPAINHINTNTNSIPIATKLTEIISSSVLVILFAAFVEISKFLPICPKSSYIRSIAYIVSYLDGPRTAATFLAGALRRLPGAKERACWTHVHSRTMNKQHIFFIMLVLLNLCGNAASRPRIEGGNQSNPIVTITDHDAPTNRQNCLSRDDVFQDI
jgi:hypothetical protein